MVKLRLGLNNNQKVVWLKTKWKRRTEVLKVSVTGDSFKASLSPRNIDLEKQEACANFVKSILRHFLLGYVKNLSK